MMPSVGHEVGIKKRICWILTLSVCNYFRRCSILSMSHHVIVMSSAATPFKQYSQNKEQTEDRNRQSSHSHDSNRVQELRLLTQTLLWVLTRSKIYGVQFSRPNTVWVQDWNVSTTFTSNVNSGLMNVVGKIKSHTIDKFSVIPVNISLGIFSHSNPKFFWSIHLLKFWCQCIHFTSREC